MPAHRINIIGAAGTGKTTLGRALAASLRIPWFDSDTYFHIPTDPPFQRQRAPAERHAMVMADLGPRPAWVLSGAVAGWEPTPRLDYTLVVFLYLSPQVRLERLRERERERFGPRVLPGGDMHGEHEAFLAWAGGYDAGTCEGTNTLPHHERVLRSVCCPVLRIEEPMTTEAQVQLILESLRL